MPIPTRYAIGDRVVIDDSALANIVTGNRSIKVHPCTSFVALARAVHDQGLEGVITHAFPPGYEVTARFGEQHFHMKDHWISRVRD